MSSASASAFAPITKINMSDKFMHIPALSREAVEFLNVRKGKLYVDCTLGGGGHTERIKVHCPTSKVIGIDRDPDAINAARERLARYDGIEYVKDNFKNLKKILKGPADGFLFDLGVSSFQIDEAERGFSLRSEGPLDMRMDKLQGVTAEDIINRSAPEELEKIFKEYGEERFSKRIARAVAAARDRAGIHNTRQLREIVEKATPGWKKRETVTRIFQALRIAVNDELNSLRGALRDAIDLLNPGGRLVVIAYHSLEDRIVKHTLKGSPLKVLTKKPVQAGEEELSLNPRAKSAKLRAGEKL